MNKQSEKYLDRLSEKVIKNMPLEHPSFNFTDSVMSQINTLKSSSAIIYKPLISKVGWGIILVIVLGGILFGLFDPDIESLGWLNGVDFSGLPKFEISGLFSGITISKTVTYSILLFGLMLSIQILFLKRHLNKQFEA